MVTLAVGQMRAFAPAGRPDILEAVAAGSPVLDAYAITTPSRTCHFLAQIAHESDGFRTTQEYASGAAYEGRRDLGNTRAGDGKRYKGRGLIQLTGRANYRAYGARLGLDLEADPARAAEPELSLRIACEYWQAKGLNALADRDDIVTITRKINGGANGLAGRKAWLAKARKLWGTLPVEAPTSSDEVRELQSDLVALGYDVPVDGRDGPKTKAAVEGVQRQAKILIDGIAGPATRAVIRQRLERRTAAGTPPADKTLIDALKTPEGLATGGGILTTILSAASSPGPLQWAIAAVVVAALAVGIGFLARRLRSAEA
jgi:putative chitinase